MKTEIEAKWLSIDKDELRSRLKDAGAELVHPERLMKRSTFDFPDKKLQKIGGWARVRDEGNEITMSFKQQIDSTLHGIKEVDIVVDSFEKASDFLEQLGLKPKSYQETKRESWTLDNCEIEIDTWPWINTFVELEAPTEKILYEVASKLQLNKTDAAFGAIEPAYFAEFDITFQQLNSEALITFDIEPPENWTRKKS